MTEYGATSSTSTDIDPETESLPSKEAISWKHSFLSHSGLHAVFAATSDVYILTFQRFLRMIAYGQTTLILVLFFEGLNNVTETEIGLFMSLTLLGDVLMSYFLTLYADDLGRRRVLALSSFLMLVSGLTFCISSNYYVLLIAAVVGVISPSGDETGPFKSIEESTLAHLTPIKHQPEIFAWYGLFATMGGAIGSLSGGFLVEYLSTKYDNVMTAYRAIFGFYSVLAALKLMSNFWLTENCELESLNSIDNDREHEALIQRETVDDANESFQDSEPSTINSSTPPKKDFLHFIFGAPLSPSSQPIVLKLLCFFAFDALGYGFLLQSWLVVYFTTQFNIKAGPLGSLLFATTVVGSFSSLFSAALYKRAGPIKAMVFTHLPSALFAGSIPLAGHNLPVAMTLLLFRAATNTMDVVPRTAFLSVVVKSDERTRVMGMVNIVKTLTRSVGPVIVGKLSENGMLWVSFIIGGLLESSYDIGLFASFYWIDRQFKNTQ
jgi:MFS family permease